ncbi:MAG TPA: hypothetical protein VFP27_16405 [Mycobacterium sp.]|nr:hypothetical protein [Mycobacterium sp.]
MKTEDLRLMTAAVCTRLKGRLWPNGLGFDRPSGSYRYSEIEARWEVVRPAPKDDVKVTDLTEHERRRLGDPTLRT